MIKNILVAYKSNWADEMGICGFRLFTEYGWSEFKNKLARFFEVVGRFNYGVGTNESIEYTSVKALLKELHVTELSNEEAIIFEDVISKSKMSKGFFPDPFVYCGDNEEDWEADGW